MTIKVSKHYSEAKYAKVEKRWTGNGSKHASRAAKAFHKADRRAVKLHLSNY